MAKAKINATTQNFIEIEDIVDDVVFFKGKNACSILEVSSVNFFLLSEEEQNARIYGYMSFVNSLSFAVQILVVSRKIDLTGYIKMLDGRLEKINNPKLAEHLSLYKEFVLDLIQGEDLLDKKVYVVIPFSHLEFGATATVTTKSDPTGYVKKVKDTLYSKRSGVIAQIQRMGLTANPLPKDELLKLFYELFNQDIINLDFNSNDIKNVIL
jgi:hypothetical protein